MALGAGAEPGRIPRRTGEQLLVQGLFNAEQQLEQQVAVEGLAGLPQRQPAQGVFCGQLGAVGTGMVGQQEVPVHG
jgi:hypothetical protein